MINEEYYILMAIRSYLGCANYDIEEKILDTYKYFKFAYTDSEIIELYDDNFIIIPNLS